MGTNELDYYIRRGKALRAEYMAELLGKIMKALRSVLRCILVECGPKKVMKRLKLPSNRLVWD
jgi:hypothetical protein